MRLSSPPTLMTVITLFALLAFAAPQAVAGPNAGGTLITYNPRIVAEATGSGSLSICAQGIIPTSCPDSAASCRIDGATSSDPAIFKVYAAFPAGSAPRLMGIAWGITSSAPVIVQGGMCGDFELPDAGWPAGPYPLGNSVTWNTVQQGLLTPVYWFRAYGGGVYSGQVVLGPNPSQGGKFGDDTVPATLDDIVGYGRMGFDVPGQPACTIAPPLPGACCHGDGTCSFVLQTDCEGVWHGGFDCTMYACPQPTGACCNLTTGACTVTLQSACQEEWLGALTTCSIEDCLGLTGGCCTNGVCTQILHSLCMGTWLGVGVICNAANCQPSVPVDHKSWGRIKKSYR
jgi:hypothetical protein